MKSKLTLFLLVLGIPLSVNAEVKSAESDGFELLITKTSPLSASDTYECFVADFSEWYDASHSYSGVPENLTLNLKQRCMLETLPNGGFVRHMEIVFHQPGRMLRMTGGLGPLQSMGVSGSLTVSFEDGEDGAILNASYNVSGRRSLQLDKLAPIVNQVLTGQFERFRKHCETKAVN